jgi:hypothetical protein
VFSDWSKAAEAIIYACVREPPMKPGAVDDGPETWERTVEWFQSDKVINHRWKSAEATKPCQHPRSNRRDLRN